MKLYIALVFSHIIGDIFMQRNSVIRKILRGRELWQLKRQSKLYIVLHVALYVLPVVLVLVYLNTFTLYGFAIVFISHFIIDYIKCYKIKYEFMSKKFFAVNIIDQFLHISILFTVVNI
ncbi:DUF3307 domain-containing protein [Clostridium thailandense]|uniref:DUF3307 domain-containing protein n=1 Tax=Clostridium thailandense TaxID=2794346 RepID=UPI0039893991